MKGKYLSSVAGIALTSILGAGGSAQAQAPNWAGSYFGVNAGWAWGRSHAVTTSDCSGSPSAFDWYYCDSATPDNGLAVDASGTGWMSGDTFIAGVQAGHNWQIDKFVYGLEADFGSFHLKGSRQASGPYVVDYNIVSASFDSYTIGTGFQTDWLFTMRGRLGWTTDRLLREHDRLLIYATGGMALTNLKTSFTFSDTEGAAASGSASGRRAGWALGAGLEYMLNERWSVKGEYLHVDFGDVCTSGTITSQIFGVGYSQGIGTCADLTADLARIGINYRL